ncbi:MAG TPA: carboxymuconolactone decarboxylase family protein [Bdellovibrionota bacterium]|jgi:alkyl hydroperoxide reductase subunit D
MSTTEFQSPLAERATTIARDLNLNLQKLMNEGHLEQLEANLSLLAAARAVGYYELAQVAKARLASLGMSEPELREAEESAAIMGMLNTYYKFRSFIAKAGDEKADEYRTTGLRMTSLAKPLLGKTLFEMLAFTVSVVNGCETCVISHERVLREAGMGAEKVHDLARIAAVVKALKVLSETNA